MPPRFADNCRILEAPAVYRGGLLKPGRTGAWEWQTIAGMPPAAIVIIAERGAVTLRYWLDATGEEVAQRVPLEFQPCKPTRGERPYWHCPACGQRCWKPFGSTDRRFACRGCLGLEYRSQREPRWQRWVRYATQRGTPLKGAPVNGMVPPSYKDRHHQESYTLRRTRLRERVLAAVAAELLRDDD